MDPMRLSHHHHHHHQQLPLSSGPSSFIHYPTPPIAPGDVLAPRVPLLGFRLPQFLGICLPWWIGARRVGLVWWISFICMSIYLYIHKSQYVYSIHIYVFMCNADLFTLIEVEGIIYVISSIPVSSSRGPKHFVGIGFIDPLNYPSGRQHLNNFSVSG